MRWRTLLGTCGYFGKGLPDEDLYFRQGEMDPGAKYPEHQGASPEVWYFISGRAKWKVDGEEFIAEPGSAVYLEPNAVSALQIISEDILFGMGEHGPTSVYDSHKHDVPEFCYVVSGSLDVTVDGHEFIAGPGELIYHKPWAVHRSVGASKATTQTVWADRGVKCDRSVLKQPYKMLGAFSKKG